MKLHLAETHNGITVQLRVKISAPSVGADSADTDLAQQALDRAHPELLRLLRHASLAAEQSLAHSAALALASQSDAWRTRPLDLTGAGATEHAHAGRAP